MSIVPGDPDQPDALLRQPLVPGPLVWFALAWCVGTVAGGLGWGAAWLWLLGGGAAVLCSWLWRRERIVLAQAAVLTAAVCVAAGWASLRAYHLPGDSIARHIAEEPALARLRGTVDSRVALSTAGGAFAAFDYRPPGTVFTVRVEACDTPEGWQPRSGRVLIKIAQADHRIRPGNRLELSGWLAQIEGPRNPGEYDYRTAMRSEGIFGRLSVPNRANAIMLPPTERWLDAIPSTLAWRQWLSNEASAALMFALPKPQDAQDEAQAVAAAKRRALLDAVLLGRRGHDALRPIADDFRDVGLAHILAISGAHLAILLGMIWLVLRLLIARPSRVAVVLLVVLGLYLLAVPAKVPILRAGIAAGIVVTGYLTGRVTRGLDLVALAVLVLLLWRPMDIFTAGFQLSFGAVVALMLFTRPLSYRLLPGSQLPEGGPAGQLVPDRHEGWPRWLADACAAALVAGLVTFPVVAYHFGMVTPLGPVLAVMALPVMAGVMGLGYVKLLASVLFPSLGMVLAGPLAWLTDIVLGLVNHAATWPGSTVELDTPPSLAWTFATLLVIVVWLAPRLRAHWSVMSLAMALCLVWLVGVPLPERGALGGNGQQAAAALKVNMFDVGNGSCVLVRIPPAPGDGDNRRGHTLMYDCGSQEYLDTGAKSIVPALEALGVERIDTLMISHADLDHYSGVLDVAKAVPVGRVLVPPQLLREAETGDPAGDATGHLVRQLRASGIALQAVSRGWSQRTGAAELRIHWPPRDRSFERANDSSLVLSIGAVGLSESDHPAALLLTGDIARVAMPKMLANGEIPRANIMNLPHHGSFIDESPAWIEHVRPRLVLQSSGPERLRRDPWPRVLERTGTSRLITDHLGMIELSIGLGAGGARQTGPRIVWTAFRDGWNTVPQRQVKKVLTNPPSQLEKPGDRG